MPHRVCPFWIGYLLASPLRRFFYKPEVLLGPYIKSGITVLDIGCAMGFFSLPAAKLTGDRGKVICVDLQQRMLLRLRRRAERAGLMEQIELREATPDSLTIDDLQQKVDFALAFAVVHELPNPGKSFAEIFQALKPNSFLLFAEPSGHIPENDFQHSVSLAERNGFAVKSRLTISRSHAVLLKRPA